ncbi:MAG: hypothetical protein HRU20_10260 [Pseudomonadales bacterium]|nr:hypothetical protein [Pseudomonadales bacterium]
MRGVDITHEAHFTSFQLENFVRKNHPLPAVKPIIDNAPKEMDCKFSTFCSEFDREPIAPERLIRAQLQIFSPVLLNFVELESINLEDVKNRTVVFFINAFCDFS